MSIRRLVRGPLAPVLTLLVLVGVWEVGVQASDMPAYLLPPPSAIGGYLLTSFDVLWTHAQATTLATLIGFAIAVVFGVALATMMVWSRSFENAVYPLLVMNQVIPKVAIAPLLIVYLGFGLEPKIFMAFLLSFFPIVINTTHGFKSVSPELLELLATLRASRWQVLYKVRARHALPYFVEGAKIGIALAVIGTVVSELVAGNRGLGYIVASSSATLQTVVGFAALVWLVVIGVTLFELVQYGGRLLTPWVRQT